MGDQTEKTGGLNRRDLIKRSAVAGAVVWAAPMIDSSVAWGGTTTDCNECDGLTLYSKYAPGNANVNDNQCLAPCPPVTVISSSVLTECGLITTDDTVHSGKDAASIDFSTKLRLIRTSIKSTSECYMSSCTDNFCSVRVYAPSDNPPCNTENTLGTTLPNALTPPVFTYLVGTVQNPVTCGTAPHGTPCGCASEVRRVEYDTNGLLDGKGRPLNYIEILLCLKGTSVLPPGCA